MAATRRATGIGVMALSVAMAVLCVAAVAATWQFSRDVSGTFDGIFGAIATALDTADSGLTLVDTSVGDARSIVDGLELAVASIGEQLAEAPLPMEGLSERLGGDSGARLRSLSESIEAVRKVAAGIRDTAAALSIIPPRAHDEDEDGPSATDRVTDGADAVVGAIDRARESVDDARVGAVGAVTSGLGLATDRIDAGLGEIQSSVGAQRDSVNAQRVEMRELEKRIQRALTIFGIAGTVSLAWILLSQAIMFVVGLSLYRGENLFDRWLAPSLVPATSVEQGNGGSA